MNELKVYKMQSIPSSIISIEDEFSKELVDLWLLHNSQGNIYVVEKEHDVVGYCLVDSDNTIRGLFVKEEYRNCGAGTLLLQTVIENHKSKTIVVNINKPAINVYIRNGFKLLGERKDFDLIIGYYGELDDELEQKLRSKIK